MGGKGLFFHLGEFIVVFLPRQGRSVPQPGGESTGDRVGDLSWRDVGWLLLEVGDLSGLDLSIVLLNLGKKEIESLTSAIVVR